MESGSQSVELEIYEARPTVPLLFEFDAEVIVLAGCIVGQPQVPVSSHPDMNTAHICLSFSPSRRWSGLQKSTRRFWFETGGSCRAMSAKSKGFVKPCGAAFKTRAFFQVLTVESPWSSPRWPLQGDWAWSGEKANNQQSSSKTSKLANRSLRSRYHAVFPFALARHALNTIIYLIVLLVVGRLVFKKHPRTLFETCGSVLF